ncbi:LOW QUALITY PROTEIN: hypothetical protein RJ639_002173, partial [Escallonia herrerae]
MSNIFANRSISGQTTLRIIDFDILFGFQWPCLMQAISLRPGGPQSFGLQESTCLNQKKRDTIQLEHLKIDGDELIVINSLYRLTDVPDETVLSKDDVLKLIRSINSDMFIQGILNGTYNAPFFMTQFREALFHFSTLFDMFEATTPLEDHERMMFEHEVFARDARKVTVNEGTTRIERPETYKQWQVRNLGAGFRQLTLNPGIVK